MEPRGAYREMQYTHMRILLGLSNVKRFDDQLKEQMLTRKFIASALGRDHYENVEKTRRRVPTEYVTDDLDSGMCYSPVLRCMCCLKY